MSPVIVGRLLVACLGGAAGYFAQSRREFFFYFAGFIVASLAWVLA